MLNFFERLGDGRSARQARAAPMRVWALLVALLLTGCASTAGGDGVIGKSLEMLGLKAPQTVEEAKAMAPAPPPKVTLRLHAGDQLNTDEQMHSSPRLTPLSAKPPPKKPASAMIFLMHANW
jgi:predicted component of type VI protein secretion system